MDTEAYLTQLGSRVTGLPGRMTESRSRLVKVVGGNYGVRRVK